MSVDDNVVNHMVVENSLEPRGFKARRMPEGEDVKFKTCACTCARKGDRGGGGRRRRRRRQEWWQFR
eukprot:258016-Rhodomonas_salina.1